MNATLLINTNQLSKLVGPSLKWAPHFEGAWLVMSTRLCLRYILMKDRLSLTPSRVEMIKDNQETSLSKIKYNRTKCKKNPENLHFSSEHSDQQWSFRDVLHAGQAVQKQRRNLELLKHKSAAKESSLYYTATM